LRGFFREFQTLAVRVFSIAYYRNSRRDDGRHANTPGYNAMLSDTFGMAGDDLANLMTRWQDQALGKSFRRLETRIE
jgi:hypothetical protein